MKTYKSKQVLPARARLNLIVFIKDIEGKHSFQIGYAIGNPKNDLFDMVESAKLNAIYKHFSLKGTPFFKGGTYDYSQIIVEVKVKEYWFEYFSDVETFNYRRTKIRGKYYLQIRRKGKIYYQEKWGYSSTKKKIVEDVEMLNIKSR